VPYNCPNCGGVLWEMDTPKAKRYRCHTGHSFTAPALLASQSEKIEEMLWIALRMFEERKNLLNSMLEAGTLRSLKESHRERLAETTGYIERIRAMLLESEAEHASRTVRKAKPPRSGRKRAV
jgi:two-component system chemotaxis response regulator CheB